MFVRHVLALFDAPVPAAAGCRALVAAGFPAGDVDLVALDAARLPGDAGGVAGHPLEPGGVRGYLSERGVPPADALVIAEGLKLGYCLVALRCPTADAPTALACLNAVGAPSLEEHAARWRAASRPEG
jgi:hypothetical protein